jgi:hypothetical protein
VPPTVWVALTSLTLRLSVKLCPPTVKLVLVQLPAPSRPA